MLPRVDNLFSLTLTRNTEDLTMPIRLIAKKTDPRGFPTSLPESQRVLRGSVFWSVGPPQPVAPQGSESPLESPYVTVSLLGNQPDWHGLNYDCILF